jgi:hypothetical protein
MLHCSKYIIGTETTDVKQFKGQMRRNLLPRTINRRTRLSFLT